MNLRTDPRHAAASDALGAFRPIPYMGVIYVVAEAMKLGYQNGHPDWCNLGQGQPEVGEIDLAAADASDGHGVLGGSGVRMVRSGMDDFERLGVFYLGRTVDAADRGPVLLPAQPRQGVGGLLPGVRVGPFVDQQAVGHLLGDTGIDRSGRGVIEVDRQLH